MSKVYGGLVSSPYNKLDIIGHFSVTHTFDGKTIDGGVEEPATIILTTFPESIGAVSGDGIFFKGSSVTVVATPDLESEYPVFVGWYNGDTKVSSNASYTFTVNSTSTLVAKFEEVKYDITLQKDPASTGTVTGGGRFVAGASVTVVATPDSESEYPEFDGWYEGETKVSENASYTFIVSGARTLVAKFKEATPPIPPGTTAIQVFADQECTTRPVVGQSYEYLYVRLNRGYGLNERKQYGDPVMSFGHVIVETPSTQSPGDLYYIELYDGFKGPDRQTPYVANTVVKCYCNTDEEAITITSPLTVDFYDPTIEYVDLGLPS